MTHHYDAIVIGAGHNGLTAAAHLARAGLATLVLERRGIVGGAAVTEEINPGFRNSSCSYVVSLLQPKVVADLDLHRRGYATIPLGGGFTPRLDGRYLLTNGDETHDRAQVAKFSNRNYDAMVRFGAIISALADVVRKQMLKPPPRLSGGGLGDLMAVLGTLRDVRALTPDLRHRFAQLFTTGVGHLIDRWFDSNIVKVRYASSATAGSFVSLYQPGSAINLLHLAMGEIDGKRGAWALAKGGMGAITGAMAAAATEFGAEIRVDAPVARVLIEGGRATGAGSSRARRSAQGCPRQHRSPPYLPRSRGRGEPGPDFAADIADFRCESGSFRMNLALSGVPEFACLPGPGIGPHHRCFMALTPSYAAFEDAWHAAARGELPAEPIIDAQIPTASDDSLAPPGCHILSLLAQL